MVVKLDKISQRAAKKMDEIVKKHGVSASFSDELLSHALRAICLTRDYVGEETLPAIEGWEWYDAGKAICEAIPNDEWAEQFRLRIVR